jgi:peptidase M23-like protein
VAAAFAGSPNNKGTVGKHHRRIIFPLLGRTLYTNNYGDPRPIGTEEGIDIMKPRRSIAVAAEAGKVKFQTDSGAGCMLYLYGRSGTMYEYIHLNNDKTKRNDNRGKCGPGMSYAPHLQSGSHVRAGQVVGFTGDSGNASGIPHLEFQVHPHGTRTVSPYPYLNKGRRLLFATLGSSTVKVTFKGTVVSTDESLYVTMHVHSLVVRPGHLHVRNVSRDLTIYVPVDAVVAEKLRDGRGPTATVSLAAAKKGRGVTITTSREAVSLPLLQGRLDTLSAAKVLLAAPK